MRAEYFDDDGSVEARIFRAIDLAHAARAESRHDLIWPQLLSCGQPEVCVCLSGVAERVRDQFEWELVGQRVGSFFSIDERTDVFHSETLLATRVFEHRVAQLRTRLVHAIEHDTYASPLIRRQSSTASPVRHCLHSRGDASHGTGMFVPSAIRASQYVRRLRTWLRFRRAS